MRQRIGRLAALTWSATDILCNICSLGVTWSFTIAFLGLSIAMNSLGGSVHMQVKELAHLSYLS